MDVEIELDITNEALKCLDNGKTAEAATKLRQALDSVTTKLVKWEKLEIKFVQECTDDNLISRLKFLHSHGCIEDRYFQACNNLRKIGNIAVHDIQRAQSLDTKSVLENAATFKQMLDGLASKTIIVKKQRTLECLEDCFAEPFEIICEAVKIYLKNMKKGLSWGYEREKANIEVKKRIYESLQIFLRNVGLFYGVEPEAYTLDTIKKYSRLGIIGSWDQYKNLNKEDWPHVAGRMTDEEERMFIFNSVIIQTIDFNPVDPLVLKGGNWGERVIIPYLSYIYFLLKKNSKSRTVLRTMDKLENRIIVLDGIPYLRKYDSLPFEEIYCSCVPNGEKEVFSAMKEITAEGTDTYMQELDIYYSNRYFLSSRYMQKEAGVPEEIIEKGYTGNTSMAYMRYVISSEWLGEEQKPAYFLEYMRMHPENEWSISSYLLQDLNEKLRDYTDETGYHPNRNLKPLLGYEAIEDTCRGAMDGEIEPENSRFDIHETLAALFYHFYIGVYPKNRYENDLKEIADQLTEEFGVMEDLENAKKEMKQKQNKEFNLLLKTLKEYATEWTDERFDVKLADLDEYDTCATEKNDTSIEN